jgi:D-alanyl-lipoteichoic acid acyltransferase DltB (MBOAT superfamily)
MLLHHSAYIPILALLAVAYWRAAPARARRPLLLIASVLFYIRLESRFFALLLGLSLADLFLARQIQRSLRAGPWFALGILANLFPLAAFKFAGWFQPHSAASPALSLVLPLGLSYYAFQAISYLAEVRRGRLDPVPWPDLFLYLAFFPKLIAGPLARPAEFFRQLQDLHSGDRPPHLAEAARLLLLGMFNKWVIADGLAAVSQSGLGALSAPETPIPAILYWQSFYLYAFLIYADFKAYTDLARGSSLLFGLDLPENFRQPYLAATPNDFWNRWHISLTRWFREHLHHPLARWLLVRFGRRRTPLLQSAASIVTMLSIGLWHGAAWPFLLWGAWHALWLVGENLVGWRPASPASRLLSGVVTFHVVAVGWVFFRAATVSEALAFLRGMISGPPAPVWLPLLPPLAAALLLLAVQEAMQSGAWPALGRLAGRLGPVLSIAALAAILGMLALAGLRGDDLQPFLYRQF